MFISKFSRKTLFNKVLSLVMAFTFLNFNTSFAALDAKVSMPSQTDNVVPSKVTVEDIGVGIDNGTVKAKYAGKSEKVIIHIQDAHCNFEAQNNINVMLDQLSKECGVNLISVEGAEGIVDTSWFRAFPDAEIRKEVATYFMKKGEITGAEYFSITSDYKGTIFGAENREDYIQNLKAFTKTYPHKPAIETYFKDLKGVVSRLKGIIYPEKLRTLDQKISSFKTKEIELSAFASSLNEYMKDLKISLKDYPNFEKLVNTLEYEKKINFDTVDQERTQFIDLLGKKMSKSEMTELVTYSIRFKKGHIKAAEFYAYLRDQAKVYNVAMQNEYPNLFYYYIYSKLYDGIDNEHLFKEIDKIEKVLKDKLFTDDTQRKLDKYSYMIDMYVNLVNIELTNEDYDIFKLEINNNKIEDVVDFIGNLSKKYNLNFTINEVPLQVRENLPNMVTFYEIAMKRDRALIDNTLKQMEKEKKNVSVLIAGGFHTRGMRELLEKQGISYVVVMPKITKDAETPYIKVLTNQRTSLEDIITENAMPGTATTKGMQKEMKGEMLSPMLRIGELIPLMLKDPSGFSRLVAELGTDGTQAAENSKALLADIVDRMVPEWLEAKKTKLYAAFGEGIEATKKADKEWARFVADGAVAPLSLYVTEYLRNSQQEINPAILEAIKKSFTRTPGSEHVKRGSQASLTMTQAENMNKAIRATLEATNAAGTTEIVPVKLGRMKNASFVLLDDNTFNEKVAELKAQGIEVPTDVECHPGTNLTRNDFAAGNITYDMVTKNFYIKKETFKKLSDSEIEVLARHEEMHIRIALGLLEVPAKMTEEDYVNSLTGCNAEPIRQKLEIMAEIASYEFEERKKAIDANDIAYMETWLREKDKDFGTAAVEKMDALTGAEKQKFVKEIFTKKYNWDLTRTAFIRERIEGTGPLRFIITSTDDQATTTQRTFNEITASQRFEASRGHDNGGQILGILIAMERSDRATGGKLEKALDDPKAKLVIIPDGGKGERASPVPQVENNKRGDQSAIGTFTDANGNERPGTLFSAVVMNNVDFTDTMGTTSTSGETVVDVVDFWWSSQVVAGTKPHDAIQRGRAAFQKFYVPVDWSVGEELLLKQFRQFGSLITDEKGEIIAFLGNQDAGLVSLDRTTGKLFWNPAKASIRAEMEKAAKEGRAGYDFGSCTMRKKMLLELWNYWREKTDANGNKIIDRAMQDPKTLAYKRDLDPDFVQPMTFLVQAVRENYPGFIEAIESRGVSTGRALRSITDSSRKERELAAAVYLARQNLPSAAATLVRMGEKDASKKSAAVDETIEFFLLHHDDFEIFGDLNDPKNVVIGAIGLGQNVDWETFRSAADITNGNLFMLNDIIGEVPSIDAAGQLIRHTATLDEKIFNENKRRWNNIKDSEICDFYIGNEHIVLKKDEIANKKWTKYGVTITNSIVRGAHLLPGSVIENSVVHESRGVIVAKDAYVDKSVANIFVERSAVYGVVGDVNVGEPGVPIVGQFVVDIFRPGITSNTANNAQFPNGQTRLVLPFNYDPKHKVDVEKNILVGLGDGYVVGTNAYSAGQLREMPCVKKDNDQIRDKIANASAIMQGAERAKALGAKFTPLKFGTSGLRDKVENLTDQEVYINTRGYIKYLKSLTNEDGIKKGVEVVVPIAGDYRKSTPRIMQAVAKAIADESTDGYIIRPELCGFVSSPAVFFRAFGKGPSVMVTGSHIPDDRNGIKFSKVSGEVLKTDEKGILDGVKEARTSEYNLTWDNSLFDDKGAFKAAVKPNYDLKAKEAETQEAYVQRYLAAFPAGALQGKRIAIYEHTAVGRDLLARILKGLGAEVVEVARVDQTERFVPMDTEKVSPVTKRVLQATVSKYNKDGKLDAIFSLDGDSDRPLLAYVDQNGKAKFLTGDKLGGLVAQFIKPQGVAVPVTTNEGVIQVLERDLGSNFVQTQVGSPLAIAGMNQLKANRGIKNVVSWEANGGFLLGADLDLSKTGLASGGVLTALPSRDAVLPLILSVLFAAKENVSVDQLIQTKLPAMYNEADVFDKFGPLFGVSGNAAFDVCVKTKNAFLPKLEDTNIIAVNFEKDTATRRLVMNGELTYFTEEVPLSSISPEDAASFAAVKDKFENIFKGAPEVFAQPEIKSINVLDGIKVSFVNGEITHFRPSGNAPEFRNYSTATTPERAAEMVKIAVTQIIPEMAKTAMGGANASSAPAPTGAIRTPGTAALRLGTVAPEGTAISLVGTVPVNQGERVISTENARQWTRELGAQNGTIYDVLTIQAQEAANGELSQAMAGRPHDIILVNGEITITTKDKQGKEEKQVIKAGEIASLDADYEDYTISNNADVPAVLKITYANTEREKTAFTVSRLVQKHYQVIQEGADIDIVLPMQLFAVKGDSNTPGTLAYEKKQMQQYFNGKVRLITYDEKVGLDKAMKNLKAEEEVGLRENSTRVLIATKENVEKAQQTADEGLKAILSGMRMMAINNLESLNNEGWMYTRDIEGTAIVQALLSVEAINSGLPISDDVLSLMQQMGEKKSDITRQDLYYMLSLNELQSLADINKALFDTLGVESAVTLIGKVIERLLIGMPMEPYNAQAQLEMRRKVMWSV